MLPAIIPSDTSDPQFIALWLHGRSPRTQRAYAADIARFLGFVQKPIRLVTLTDLQNYQDDLTGYATSTQARRIAAVKSLLTLAQRTGYTLLNAGAPVKAPKVKDTLAQRIMSEENVLKLLALESDPTHHALLRLLYKGGLRASEAAALRWHDLAENGDAGQVTVFGKGDKTRVVKLPDGIYQELLALRGEAPDDAPIFPCRTHRYTRHDERTGVTTVTQHDCISATQVWRIVKAAAKRAGLKAGISPHWLRHAHASHSLDRGAPPQLVRDTLGHASIATLDKYAHAKPHDSSARFLPG